MNDQDLVSLTNVAKDQFSRKFFFSDTVKYWHRNLIINLRLKGNFLIIIDHTWSMNFFPVDDDHVHLIFLIYYLNLFIFD
jgi:hypothetical protein